MTLSVEYVRQKLSERTGFNLEIIVNENRSSMLSVLSKKGKWAKLSIHRMFLHAPDEVIEAVAKYVKNKEDPSFKVVRSFIHANIQRVDYSHRLNPMSLSTQGRIYNLQEIFDEINQEYFMGKVKLGLTWVDKPHKKTSRIVYGQYYETLKLIKISKLLDDIQCPRYFLAFVIYHEMLHHVVPSYIDEKGVHCIHSKQFKEREMQFKDFQKAKAWELEFRHRYFAELN
jgi:hypothetical protein